MAFSSNVWNQLKNLSVDDFIAALERDGYVREERRGAVLCYVKSHHSVAQRRRIVVHYHPGKTWGAKFLKGLLKDTGWDEDDLRRLKLIK